MSHAIAPHFAHHRILWSRLIVACALAYFLFGTPPQLMDGWTGEVSRWLGYALLVCAALWRVWCLIFIGGTKDGQLAVTGPYSMTRNPLYIGNFLGVLGFGFAVCLPLLPLAFLLMFAALYPAVVAQEEARLEAIFGEPYRRYCATTPRWLPRWSQYTEPETVTVSPKRMREGMLDAMWFLWAFLFIQVVEKLHAAGLLPRLF